VDVHVGGDDAQEGPAGVSGQDFARRTRATRQCDRSHVRHGVVSLRGFGLARMSEHPLHNR
jgi:hypothetical protein